LTNSKYECEHIINLTAHSCYRSSWKNGKYR